MKNRFWLLSLVLLLLSVSLDIYFLSEKRELRAFKQSLRTKEKVAKKQLEQLAGELSNPATKVNLKSYHRFYKDGISFFGYKNDSLLFWSDNHVNIDTKYDDRFDGQGFLHFNNGKYLALKKNLGELKLVALLQITLEYPIQNKFLRSGLHKSFSPVHKIQISLQKSDNEDYNIVNNSGEYLFTISINKSFRENTPQAYLVSILYLLMFFCSCFFFFFYLKGETRFAYRRLYILFFGIGLCVLRYMMIKFKLPPLIYSLSLFSPTQYASSYFFASLGDFMLNSLSFFLLAYAFSSYYELSRYTQKRWWFYIVLCGSILIFIILYYNILDLLKNLILDSKFSLQIHSSGNLNQYNIWGLLSILFFIFGFLFVIRIFSKWGSQHLAPFRFLLICVVIISLGVLLFYAGEGRIINALFLFILFVLYGIYAYSKRSSVPFVITTVIHIITAIFLVQFIHRYSTTKEKENRKTLAINLAEEYDPISMSLLTKIGNELKNDDYLLKNFIDPYENENIIKEYLKAEYFTNYWELFDVRIFICNENDKIEIIEENDDVNCFSFFSDIIQLQQGEKLANTDFYLLEKFDGKIAYLGVLSHSSLRFGMVNLYIELVSLPQNEGLGYPVLLLDQKYALNKIPEEYAYAKYSNDQLLISSGKYDYDWTINPQIYQHTSYNQNGYNHFVYAKNSHDKVIVSKPMKDTSVYWINLLYVFIFLLIFCGILRLIEQFPWNRFNFSTYGMRIRISYISMIIIFFTITILLTLYSTYSHFKQKNLDELNEKLTTLKNEIHRHLNTIEVEETDFSSYFTDILRDYSALLKTDINIYDKHGSLVSTSRNELFEKGLQGKIINPYVLRQLNFQGKSKVIVLENLGSLKFSSAYVGLTDRHDRTSFYLNLPYFQRYEKLQLELLSIIIGVLNIYLLVALISIFFSILYTNKLTSSLKLIQDKFKKLRLKGENKHIIYPKKDEIKNLVLAYNTLVDELEESTKALVKSEREMAWREMAQQVAHEIKNPLTPMRLSLQFLQKSYKENPSVINKQLPKTTKLLFEQIDQLSTIATEFSNFARMPKSKNTPNNLVKVVERVLQFYKNSDFRLHFTTSHKDIPVLIDSKLFERVFLNLIQNAHHAIAEKADGKVEIWTSIKDKKVISYVRDNGKGIEPRNIQHIFSPSFTTKSGGMGLGLVIVKNIVNDANGEITFTTEINMGTTFFIELPLHLG